MTELLTAAQMRAIEAAAIASGVVTGLELMERAGRGVVEAVLAEWPEFALAPHRAVVLCGPGNNGGDGFVVARLLKERGWEVEVFLYGEEEKLPPDAKVNCARWRGMGEVRPLSECFSHRWAAHPVVFDAVFGIGLARPFPDEVRNVLMATLNCRRVSVDIPSFVGSDDGKARMSWPSVLSRKGWANLTVTFHARKVGHCIADGAVHSGKVVVSDIGLRSYGFAFESSAPLERVTLVSLAGALQKRAAHHKYTHGHALILSGPASRTGAARLAARGALRIGAGLVTVGAPAGALAEHAARLDAVMLREVGDGAALAQALTDARINALCLGPGLGLDARAAGLVGVALGLTADPPSPSLPHEGGGGRPAPDHAANGETSPPAPPLPLVGRGWGRGAPGAKARPTVLDADALTLISRDPDLFAALHANCVLTPHAGEFARLFPDIAAKLAGPATKGPAYSKVDATREAARRAGCVVLFKGPDTVIADPSGRAAINSAHYDRAAPWLATAGSGDVLAGFITGLLARGFDPFDAACTAAWLHVDCARAFGPGLIAEDLPEMLPKVFRDLGLARQIP